MALMATGALADRLYFFFSAKTVLSSTLIVIPFSVIRQLILYQVLGRSGLTFAVAKLPVSEIGPLPSGRVTRSSPGFTSQLKMTTAPLKAKTRMLRLSVRATAEISI